MLRDIDNYFLQKQEPARSCLLALRNYIINYNNNITEAWKYRMPFYCYKGKMFCYLWTNKSTGQPYIGIVEGNKITHRALIQEKRSRMKIMVIDSNKDLPIQTIRSIFKSALKFYP